MTKNSFLPEVTFNLENKAIKKQVGLYEIESIDNASVITISVNPKEYFEKV